MGGKKLGYHVSSMICYLEIVAIIAGEHDRLLDIRIKITGTLGPLNLWIETSAKPGYSIHLTTLKRLCSHMNPHIPSVPNLDTLLIRGSS